ncbi:hypothetical protein E8E11_001784 [Didymella keratinophila]|nr:hypothetical protein E8E11_001784 [Didymella keratinophila]
MSAPSSSSSSAAATGNLPQVPPSGHGATEATAQYTAAFSKDTSQPSFVAHTQLTTIKYHRCTEAEAKYYKESGCTVYKANGQFSRPIAFTSAVDPAAFFDQLEKARNAEKALEDAGETVGHEESLTADANENGGAMDEKSEAASSGSSESGDSGDVFDKPEKS